LLFFSIVFLGVIFSKCIRNHLPPLSKPCQFYLKGFNFDAIIPYKESCFLRHRPRIQTEFTCFTAVAFHYSTTQIIVLLLIGVWFYFHVVFIEF
jgi:hypothetical protein